VLFATVSCHGLRPPNHLYVILLYDNRTGVDQCLWLSLVICRIGYLSARFLGESLVYILRENSSRTEELNWILGYPQRCFGLFIRIRLWALTDLTFELDK
jgi:hypothetical protein